MEKATVVDLVLKYPEERGDETVIVFLDTKGEEKQKYSFNSLKKDCLSVAANLLPLTKRREVVLLLAEDQGCFVTGFFGAMLAGCIPAPLATFKNVKDKQGYGRMLHILKKNESTCVLVEAAQYDLIKSVLENESLNEVRIITIESLLKGAEN